jgi:hypothetical protein
MVAPTSIAPPAAREGEGDRAPLGPSKAGPADAALAALLAGAGLVHVAMAPAHLTSSAADGVGFLVVGVVQLLVAVLVVARPSRGAYGIAAAVSAVALGAWLVSRTVGLPYGAHEGVAERVAFVDGATAVLEGLALVGAGLLLARGAAPRAGGVALKVLAVGAVVLSVAAIASPSAREHGHDDAEAAGGHGHDTAATGDDLGYSELVNGQMGAHEHEAAPADALALLTPDESGALAAQLAATAQLVEAYPTIADARAAGYRQQGPFSPGLGVHFSAPGGIGNADGDMDPEDIAAGMLIYDGIEEDSRLAGFMYMSYQADPPQGFVGDLDQWHFHTATCIVVTPDGIDTPFGADLTGITREMCEAEGGTLIDFTGYMVHVWTVPGYESPEGLFSDLNPRITCPDGTYYTIETRDIGGADTTCLYP